MQNEVELKKEALQKEMNLVYTEVGRLFYEDHKKDTNLATKYVKAFVKIKPLYAELEKIEAEELSAQGLKKCSSCQAKITLESRFCNMCGVKLAEDAVQAVVKEVPKKRLCNKCGVELENDAVFCANCGMRQ